MDFFHFTRDHAAMLPLIETRSVPAQVHAFPGLDRCRAHAIDRPDEAHERVDRSWVDLRQRRVYEVGKAVRVAERHQDLQRGDYWIGWRGGGREFEPLHARFQRPLENVATRQ